MSIPYTATTRGIRVTVRATYLEDQSDPERHAWVWAYRVEISNLSRVPVRLLKRTWLITDGAGQTMRVHGEGVVGEQPYLEPGDEFTYTSGTPLATPTGFMRGQYHMIETETGEEFDVAIPAFSLDSPHHMGGLH